MHLLVKLRPGRADPMGLASIWQLRRLAKSDSGKLCSRDTWAGIARCQRVKRGRSTQECGPNCVIISVWLVAKSPANHLHAVS